MKRVLTTKKERAQKILSLFDSESVDYVRDYKEEIDNLTVVEYSPAEDDWVEVDPSEEIHEIECRYVLFGIDEDLIDGYEDFETIYEALCDIEDS